MILCDVVHVHIARSFDDEPQHTLEGVMQGAPGSNSLLEGGIHYQLLDLGPLLVVDQAQVVGILTHLSQDVVGVGETVSDGNALESSQEPFILFLLFLDFEANGWRILARIALTEDDEVLAG